MNNEEITTTTWLIWILVVLALSSVIIYGIYNENNKADIRDKEIDISNAKYQYKLLYRSGRFADAKPYLIMLAKDGDSDAQFYLGCMSMYGKGSRENSKAAKRLFGLSCDNGNQKACDMYKKVDGISSRRADARYNHYNRSMAGLGSFQTDDEFERYLDIGTETMECSMIFW